jgi:nitroreductase
MSMPSTDINCHIDIPTLSTYALASRKLIRTKEAMNTLEAAKTRTTPAEFTTPAPGATALQAAFDAAVAAPDHARLRPWRFITIEGDARSAFGAVMADALKRRKPDASEGDLHREAAKALRAPLLIVAVAKTIERPGVPEIEQLMAVGAAIQNLSLALFDQGFATAWKTGDAAYDPTVKTTLGLDETDSILAFLYVGTPKPSTQPARPRPAAADFVRSWVKS